MKKVLHALEYSMPKLAGYSIRSKYIIDNQQHEGIDPVVITSPLHGKRTLALEQPDEIDSVKYYRTGVYNRLNMDERLFLRLMKRYAYSRAYLKSIKWVAEKEGVDIIHAHSSYLNGVRANTAAKDLGIPSVYEVRGLWQDTASVNVDIDTKHWKYRFIDYMDRKAYMNADRVVTISRQLKDELLKKGVPENHLYVVPNGVDTAIFHPRPKNPDIIKKYMIEGKTIIGFIGSVGRLEGLHLLLENLGNLTRHGKDIRVMIIGDGGEAPRLKVFTHENHLDDYVIFTGRVPHDEIFDYYAVMDILIYPRINAKVCHKVTPLKPLEAMSMQKAVIASDVGGLKELVEDDKTGLLFRVDDGDHFVRRCLDLIDNPGFREQIGKQAREWVVRERDWKNVIKLYEGVYSSLC